MNREFNLLTTTKYPDRDICEKCKHFISKEDKYFGDRQVMDSFCIDCYTERLMIVTRFEKKVKELEGNHKKEHES